MESYSNDRRETRSCVATSVYITVDGSCDERNVKEILGTTFDASKSGIGIYTTKRLTEGDVVFDICSGALWEKPRKAVVRWCRVVGDGINGLYRTGLLLC